MLRVIAWCSVTIRRGGVHDQTGLWKWYVWCVYHNLR